MVTDIVALIDKFASSPGVPIKARGDIEPPAVDLKIIISNIVAALDAFRGWPYPFDPSVKTFCP